MISLASTGVTQIAQLFQHLNPLCPKKSGSVPYLTRERNAVRTPALDFLLALRPNPDHHSNGAVSISAVRGSTRRPTARAVPAGRPPPAPCSRIGNRATY